MLSHFSHVQLFAALWTLACQAPMPMGFSRQEYWSVLLCPPPGNLPDPGIEPVSPAASALQADSLPLSHWESPLREEQSLWKTFSGSRLGCASSGRGDGVRAPPGEKGGGRS